MLQDVKHIRMRETIKLWNFETHIDIWYFQIDSKQGELIQLHGGMTHVLMSVMKNTQQRQKRQDWTWGNLEDRAESQQKHMISRFGSGTQKLQELTEMSFY